MINSFIFPEEATLALFNHAYAKFSLGVLIYFTINQYTINEAGFNNGKC